VAEKLEDHKVHQKQYKRFTLTLTLTLVLFQQPQSRCLMVQMFLWLVE
jgi:hypothetical protein